MTIALGVPAPPPKPLASRRPTRQITLRHPTHPIKVGGDAPVSLFMGDLPFESESHRLEDLLPETLTMAADVDASVYRLLHEGRKKDSGFDLRHSPLAAHLYARLGDAATDAVVEAEDGWPLLDALPAEVVLGVVEASAQIATTRVTGFCVIAERVRARAAQENAAS